MDATLTISRANRIQRNAIRNGFITSTVDELRTERAYRLLQGDRHGADCLQEMIDECEAGQVTNYGDLPAF